MVSVTLVISEELKTKMSKLPWVNWSETAREDSIKEAKLEEELSKFNKLASKSRLSEAEAVKLGIEFNKLLRKRRSG